MAIFNGFAITTPPISFAAKCGSNYGGLRVDPGPSVTTYQYRFLATGVEGSTTSAASIPAGTVVVGIY
jgi:hypothetical protein